MKRLTGIFFFFIFCFSGGAQLVSPLNQKAVKDTTAYSFIVSGHWHGSSNNQSGFPASSILANIDLINHLKPSFIALTGDLFLDASKDLLNYKRSLLDKLNAPVFNAPGNHDFAGGKMAAGTRFFSFKLGSEFFIFLDTESDNGDIEGEQLQFFIGEIKNAGYKGIKNIFIFSHRPVWAEEDETFAGLFKGNTRSAIAPNYKQKIEPEILKLKSKNVYWTSGSMGGEAPVSFFYHKHKNGITFIQTAIRDLPRDGILQVNVHKGKVNFKTISLNYNPVPALEECTVELWKKGNPDAGFNTRLIPLYLYNMVMHRYFWYGILYTVLFFIFLILLRRLKLKRVGKKA